MNFKIITKVYTIFTKHKNLFIHMNFLILFILQNTNRFIFLNNMNQVDLIYFLLST